MVIKSGNVLFEGTPAELKAHAERYVWEYRVSPNELDTIMAENEVIQLLEEGDGVNVRVFAKKEEEGAATFRKRQIENEPVFGQIKHNQQFQRFLLRGLPKITLEWGLICAATI